MTVSECRRWALNKDSPNFVCMVENAMLNMSQLVSPTIAAKGMVAMLEVPPLLQDCHFYHSLVEFGRFLKVPALNSNTRTVMVWMKVSEHSFKMKYHTCMYRMTSKCSHAFQYSEPCTFTIRYPMLHPKEGLQLPCIILGHHLYACCCSTSCFNTLLENVNAWLFYDHTILDTLNHKFFLIYLPSNTFTCAYMCWLLWNVFLM